MRLRRRGRSSSGAGSVRSGRRGPPFYPKRRTTTFNIRRTPTLINGGLAEVQQGPPIPKPTRRPRADGERNRTRLIAEAKRACAEKGAAVSLEHIAREADVSIATLYRHFPTRDELISAVYQQEVDMLIEAADQLMAEREPAMALRECLTLFVDFLDAKYGMAEAMNTPSSAGRSPSTAEPRTTSTFPLRHWSPVGSRLASFGTTSSRTICSVRSLAWHTLDQASTGSGRQFGWSIFC